MHANKIQKLQISLTDRLFGNVNLVDDLIDAWEGALADDFQWRDILTIAQSTAETLVPVVMSFSMLTNEQKREIVVETTRDLFDAVIEPIDLPWLPDSLVDPILRKTITWLAETTFDRLVEGE